MISVKSRKKVLSAKGLNYTMIAAYKKNKNINCDWLRDLLPAKADSRSSIKR